MAEYIEKQAAISLPVLPKEHREYPTFNLDDVYEKGWNDALECVEKIPPDDVRPVARGRWLWRHRHRGGFRRVTGEDDFGARHTITIDERYQIDDPYCPFCGKLNESVFLNFCPNCGADMRGGDAE